MSQSPAPQSQSQRQINIELPPDLEAIYTNFAMIGHTPSEVIIDFVRLLPGNPRAKVQVRVLMTPMNAKLLLNALSENLERFEAQFGPIVIPQGGNIAEQLFHPPQPPQ
jgi:Protein of unknown function (DUF3467)